MDFEAIYHEASRAIDDAIAQGKSELQLTFHISPGTPVMGAVWVILAKSRFPAELIHSSQKFGVQTASVPFKMSVEFVADAVRMIDKRAERAIGKQPEAWITFDAIGCKGERMADSVEKARRVAPHRVPVLLQGESGVGKEVFAKAIHNEGLRRHKPFEALNCGAIPEKLIESELFGHVKGAFSDATADRKGAFARANGGTLLLDEIGELPPLQQVKLLRVLQEQEITPVGSSKPPIPVDVRIIAATNRQLSDDVRKGRFRGDLFYRLAVAVITIPPLRERGVDIEPLVDRELAEVYASLADGIKRTLSTGAREVLLRYSWPGNVRELMAVLTRACLWSTNQTLDENDIRSAIFGELNTPETASPSLSEIPPGFSLRDHLGEIARHHLETALAQTGRNKTAAAKLLGIKSHQALGKWLGRCGVVAG